MIKFTVFGDLHFDEVEDGNRRVNELVEHGDYLSVTPDDVELHDYKWNGVSIKRLV